MPAFPCRLFRAACGALEVVRGRAVSGDCPAALRDEKAPLGRRAQGAPFLRMTVCASSELGMQSPICGVCWVAVTVSLVAGRTQALCATMHEQCVWGSSSQGTSYLVAGWVLVFAGLGLLCVHSSAASAAAL